MPRLSAEHRPERSPDPQKHARPCRRFPLSTPCRPNAATVQRRGDLPKRLRPGSLGLSDGSRDAIAECVGAGRWFALAIVWVAVWPQWGDSCHSETRRDDCNAQIAAVRRADGERGL
jgi:hypothetical protein